jgi:predicted DNA-binding antitoxin AbrB/MazE fold protein
MSTRIEAAYEDGVLKPLVPLRDIQEHARVVITVEAPGVVEQFRGVVRIDPTIAIEITDSADYSLLDS